MNLRIIALTIFPLLTACGENPIQKFRLHITDENGKPIAGATGKAWFNTAKTSGMGMDSYLVNGTTDNTGIVELKGETLRYQTAVGAEADGYYSASKGEYWMKSKSGNKWQPWPVEESLVLKKIVNPKPMYAARFDGHGWLKIPQNDEKSYGFDLMTGDWVEPYGKGQTADFIIQGNSRSSPGRELRADIKLEFSNAGDGIQKIEDEGGSDLIGPVEAPIENYAPAWTFANWKAHPTSEQIDSGDFSDEVYIFRIRTVIDDNGRVISSIYGKIHGRIIGKIAVRTPRLLMTYYLNAKPNDRGLEWDMKTNLYKDLPEQNWPQNP